MSNENTRSLAMWTTITAIAVVVAIDVLLVLSFGEFALYFITPFLALLLIFGALALRGNKYGYLGGFVTAAVEFLVFMPFLITELFKPTETLSFTTAYAGTIVLIAIIPAGIQAYRQAKGSIPTRPLKEGLPTRYGALALIFLGLGIGGILTSAAASNQLVTSGGLVSVLAEADQTIEVRVGDNFFDPDVLNIPTGQLVKLVLTNEGTAHTFTIAELGLNKELGAGRTVELWVRLDEVRSFNYICAVPGHLEDGMEGTLFING